MDEETPKIKHRLTPLQQARKTAVQLIEEQRKPFSGDPAAGEIKSGDVETRAYEKHWNQLNESFDIGDQ